MMTFCSATLNERSLHENNSINNVQSSFFLNQVNIKRCDLNFKLKFSKRDARKFWTVIKYTFFKKKSGHIKPDQSLYSKIYLNTFFFTVQVIFMNMKANLCFSKCMLRCRRKRPHALSKLCCKWFYVSHFMLFYPI